jgi:hypothetical protein
MAQTGCRISDRFGSIGVALPGVAARVAAFEDAAHTMPAGELMVRTSP